MEEIWKDIEGYVKEECDDFCVQGKFYGFGYSAKPLIIKE